MAIKIWGIDVSKYNYPIDWKKVKAAGVKFAILRCGYAPINNRTNLQKDPYFEKFYIGAKGADIPVGVYFYSRCNSTETAIAEARFIINCLKGKKLEYPVWLDVEDATTLKTTSKGNMTKAVKTCLEELEKAGYYVGLYSGKYILRDELNDEELKNYDKWIAQYADACTYNGEHTMWQFGGETNLLRNKKIDGIGNDVADQNYCYIDYPTLIKAKGLNGYNVASNTTSKSNTNPKVKSLQTALNKSYNCKLSVNGLYEPKTKAIVKKHYLKPIAKNNHVKWLQQALKDLGYIITVDGSYGPATAKVVKEFQKKNKMSVDGYAGLATHNKLIEYLK